MLLSSLYSSLFFAFRTASNKAVADGAVSYHLDHFVSMRVSRFAFGVQCSVPYDANIKDHRLRSSSVYTSLSGQQLLPRVFDIILDKVGILTGHVELSGS